jgi:chloramphenicol-sensitive protein RarD
VGLLAASTAYAIWGVFPFFYHQLNGVPPFEVLCHRICWSLLFCLILLAAAGKLTELLRTLTTLRSLVGLLLSGLCVSINWGAYIWAVSHDQALDASMAYYAMPLVTVGLGVALLRERLTRRQGFAIAIVIASVVLLTIDRGRLPWVVLTLPISFGLYGFVRKLVVVDALVGVTIETLLLTPLALGYLLTRPDGGAILQDSWSIRELLILCGPVTTIPLVLFGFGARRMTLSALGLLQYINPTLQMLIAVILLHEPLAKAQFAAFAMIWLGLLVYSWPAGRERAAG